MGKRSVSTAGPKGSFHDPHVQPSTQLLYRETQRTIIIKPSERIEQEVKKEYFAIAAPPSDRTPRASSGLFQWLFKALFALAVWILRKF